MLPMACYKERSIMNSRYSVYRDSLVVHLDKELDHHQAEIIRNDTKEYIEYCQIKNIIFDFCNTTFMDSSGIGLIMGRYKVLSETGGRVYAVEVNESVKRIFRMSGLFKIVEVFDNLDELICMQRI
mgnify:CR=1 FL=1